MFVSTCRNVQGSAKRQTPGFMKFVTALAYHFCLPGFACSIHATWGPPFSRTLYTKTDLQTPNEHTFDMNPPCPICVILSAHRRRPQSLSFWQRRMKTSLHESPMREREMLNLGDLLLETKKDSEFSAVSYIRLNESGLIMYLLGYKINRTCGWQFKILMRCDQLKF